MSLAEVFACDMEMNKVALLKKSFIDGYLEIA